jgi:hypothetical protein
MSALHFHVCKTLLHIDFFCQIRHFLTPNSYGHEKYKSVFVAERQKNIEARKHELLNGATNEKSDATEKEQICSIQPVHETLLIDYRLIETDFVIGSGKVAYFAKQTEAIFCRLTCKIMTLFNYFQVILES